MSLREEQKEKRRADILSAGLDAFVNCGYSGTKIRDIADRLNMSLGLLFHYFPSKEALYTELVRLGVSGPNSMVAQIKVAQPLEFFALCAEQTLMYAQSSEFMCKMFVLMDNAAYGGDIPSCAREIVKNIDFYRQTVPMIEAGQKNGTIKQGDALALSTAFWAALQGAIGLHAKDNSLPLPSHEWIVDIIKNNEI